MVYDIAAIQYLYGAAEYNEDNTTYKYNRNEPFVEAIWDSSGYDTLDLTGFTKMQQDFDPRLLFNHRNGRHRDCARCILRKSHSWERE